MVYPLGLYSQFDLLTVVLAQLVAQNRWKHLPGLECKGDRSEQEDDHWASEWRVQSPVVGEWSKAHEDIRREEVPRWNRVPWLARLTEATQAKLSTTSTLALWQHVSALLHFTSRKVDSRSSCQEAIETTFSQYESS